ncbi:MAG: hypothetical protein WCG05_00285 [Alphaproteobacteria bacterium]
MKRLSTLLSCFFALLLSCCNSPPGVVAADALGVVQTAAMLSIDGQNLRNGLQQLAFKLNSYASYNASQFQNATNAQQVSAAIASVAQTLSNSTVANASNEAAGMQSYLPYDITVQRPFYVPPATVMSSTWDSMIYPHVIVRMIHIQASYAAAMVQMVSQNMQYMFPGQMAAMAAMVQGLIARLGSLPV